MEAQEDKENNGSCEKDPSLSSNNFKVKIKIPKLMKDEGADRGDEDVNNVCEEKNLFTQQKKEHICCECGKEFSSGKALGGHMSSAHVQANQRLEESLKKKKNFTQEKKSLKLMKRSFDDEEIEEEEEDVGDGVFDKIICELCGKNFPSKKSLFGHMRCHPDRDWRGMKPPTKKIAKNKGFRANFHDQDEDGDDRFANLQDEDEDDEEEQEEIGVDVDDDVPPPLMVWGAKDRRGRSPLKRTFRRLSLDDEDKDIQDAVQQLIRLVNGDDNNNNDNNTNSEVICSSNSVGSAPKEAPLSDLKDKSKKKVVVDEENREEACSNSLVGKKRKREKEIIKLEPGKDLVPSPVIKKSPEVKHKCNICGKIFASHQALGGHRSSHNKFKISIENTIDRQDQEIKARNQENNTQDHVVQLGDQVINNCNIIIDQNGSNNNTNNNNVHKCKIWDKIFPTGQALGGHQSSHLTNNQAEESSSQIASNVLDFDLNELPNLDDDRLL